MKITAIDTWPMTAGWRTLVYLKVRTDQGIDGVGEATVERNTREVLSTIENFKSFLIGANPLEINHLWQQMRGYPIWPMGAGTLAAMSGIEIACWDILGKYLNAPVHQLLGGKVRDRTKAYANGWFQRCKTIGDFADAAGRAIEREGYQALKWDPFGAVDMTMNAVEERKAVECVREVRKAVGPDVDLMIEFHFKFDAATALRLAKRLEQFDPYWYEDPLRVAWYNPDTWKVLRQATSVPLMEGGSWDRWGFRRIIEQQWVQHVMPDIIHCGGLLEALRIAAMAETYGMTCSPHNVGGIPARAAVRHFAAATPNFLMLEHLPMYTEHPAVTDVSTVPLPEVREGYVEFSSEPGLGVNLDNVETIAEKFPYEPEKDAPKLGLHGFTTIDCHPISEEEQAFMKARPPRDWPLDYS